eukprot:3867284-Pleurochrysis_carterae.AAC.1
MDKKEERRVHLLKARADKRHYYYFRNKARQPGTDTVPCIIDKMDGNKNKCPRYPPPARAFIRPPKAAEDQLKNAMKLHVVGVIFHGGNRNEEGVNSDLISLLAALPHLAGNSNLNCKCLYRALKYHFEEHGMLPRLHILASKLCVSPPPRALGFNNASDNKSRWVLGFCARLVRLGYVKEIHLSMMRPGHTHEDIDAVFSRISAYWRQFKRVLNPFSFMMMLAAAVPKAFVHPLV